MKLELNLVKVQTIDSPIGKLLSRSRVEVNSETEVMSAICSFIKNESSAISTLITDQLLVSKLSSISNLTITEFQCLRYMLASKGLDIWYWIVSDQEMNPVEIDDQIFEYNILDYNQISGSFVPKTSKLIQSSTENSLTDLYTKINEGYSLFNGQLFTGFTNPIINTVSTMKTSESVIGMVAKAQSTYVNSLLEFIGLRLKVLMN